MGECTYAGLTIRVVVGDLLHITCDAIVNPSNTALYLGSGVSGAIRQRGGPTIQRALDRIGSVGHCDAVRTAPGELTNCHAIIHAAVISHQTEGPCIRRATTNVLITAEHFGDATVAFPALGTGVGRVKPAVAAQEMLAGIADFCQVIPEPRVVRTVIIALYETELVGALEQALQRLTAP